MIYDRQKEPKRTLQTHVELIKIVTIYHTLIFLWHLVWFLTKNELILTSEQNTERSALALFLAYPGQLAPPDARGIVAHNTTFHIFSRLERQAI